MANLPLSLRLVTDSNQGSTLETFHKKKSSARLSKQQEQQEVELMEKNSVGKEGAIPLITRYL